MLQYGFSTRRSFAINWSSQFGHICIPFAEPTDSTIDIVRASREALDEIFVRGTGYKKAGVIASGILPREGVTVSMFDAEHQERHRRLMQTLDSINSRVGDGAVVVASAGLTQVKANSAHRSPGGTTKKRTSKEVLFFVFSPCDVEPTTFVVLLALCMMVCVQAHTIIHNPKAFGSVLHRELSITMLCSAALLT